MYTMYLENGEHFLMAARKRKKVRRSTWVLSRHVEDLKRDSDNCIAKVRGGPAGRQGRRNGRGGGTGEGGAHRGWAQGREGLWVLGAGVDNLKGPMLRP